VGRGCPSVHRGRVWRGGSALSPKFFWDFGVKMAYFRALLVLNFVFSMTKKSIEIHQEYKDCHGDSLACDKERYSGVSIPLSLSPWSKFPSNSR